MDQVDQLIAEAREDARRVFAPRPDSRPDLTIRFTEAESDAASDNWGANCGPHSLAAAAGKTLDEIRAAIGPFKGWMNPTMVSQALVRLGIPAGLTHRLKTTTLCNGINRIQWEGKWLNPGVPARVAYHHTHWVAHFDGWVLCTAAYPYLWCRAGWWAEFLRACGKPWHVTHHYSFPDFKRGMSPAAPWINPFVPRPE